MKEPKNIDTYINLSITATIAIVTAIENDIDSVADTNVKAELYKFQQKLLDVVNYFTIKDLK